MAVFTLLLSAGSLQGEMKFLFFFFFYNFFFIVEWCCEGGADGINGNRIYN